MSQDTKFLEKSAHLKDLSDAQLKERFWDLTKQIVDPLLTLSYEYTSPSIERSILLRMGFSSIEASKLVEVGMNNEMMSKGIGHCVYKYAQLKNITIKEAGLELMTKENWQEVKEVF